MVLLVTAERCYIILFAMFVSSMPYLCVVALLFHFGATLGAVCSIIVPVLLHVYFFLTHLCLCLLYSRSIYVSRAPGLHECDKNGTSIRKDMPR